ncbi:hypothetical protein [Paenibacillus hamazuiensis]|uniref:hypothetical protein n=1 Tax=Paenibacillus hamazuiensis TaxID=2936508 RepID=UPI00200DCBEC|nr:hypothetical protein [Paenibacillus hamazuiensis]
MDKNELLRELQLLPERLRQAEETYYKAVADLENAKFSLQVKKSQLFHSGMIGGKNEQQRDAEVWQHTHELQHLVLKYKLDVDRHKVECDYWSNKLQNVRLVVELILQRTAGIE